jgi:hypothetical protein
MILIVPARVRFSRSLWRIGAAVTLLCTNHLMALGQDRTSPAELQVRGAFELGIICSGCGVVPSAPMRARHNSSAEPVSSPEAAIADILNDSSLRPGDLVMFPDGLKVFQGGVAPYTPDRFRPASQALQRQGDVRRR